MDHWLKKKIGFQNYYWATIVLSSVFFTFVFISTFSSSLDWALTSDNAIMSYSSWMIKSGKVPYKDIFDFNLPGTYLVHIFSLTLFNSNVEIGYRVLELLLLLSINVISVLPLNIPIRQRIPLLGIAFIFNTHIIIQGPNMAFQRDTWIALGLAIFIIKTHFDSNYSELVIRGRNVSLFFDFFTQFIIGFLACVKPSILILGFIPILIAKTGHRRLISILGLGFPILLILIWLAMVGGLRDFIDIFYNYIWKLYPSALITGPFYHLNQEFIFNIPIIMGGLGGLITIFIYKQYKTAWIKLSATLFGIFHIAIQNKGFTYHYYPLIAVFVITLIIGINYANKKGNKLLKLFFVLVIVAEIFLELFFVLPKYKIDFKKKSEYQNAVRYSELITAKTNMNDSIMIFDVGDGLSTAMYWQKRPICSRFLYDLIFFHDLNDPYIKNIHNDLLEQVSSQDCSVIIVSEQSFGGSTPYRINLIDGLSPLIEKYYQQRDSDLGLVYVLKEK